MKRIGILAVQGAFIEHEYICEAAGFETVELRKKADAESSFDALILPGGESTVQGKLLRSLDMFGVLKQRIQDGVPVLATCAGLILLAEKIENDEAVYFGTLPVSVVRNAYGRQLGSFYAEEEFKGLGKIPMTFIRAPYVSKIGVGVETLAKVNGKIVAARYKNQTALSFHPELNSDRKIFEQWFSSF